MKPLNGFIVDIDYVLEDEKTKVYLYGKLENNESFVSIHTLKPYFFIKEVDYNKHKPLFNKYKAENTNLTTFRREKVIKISHNSHIELSKLHHAIHKKIETYEADIKPSMRFIIDNNLLGSLSISGDYQTSKKVNRIYNSADIKHSDYKPELKVISLDTESDHKGNLYCIGLYGKNYKKCFLITDKTDKSIENVIPCKSEEECLQKFRDEIIKQDPDIITGWNMIGFDLVYLQQLFKKHKMPFDIGRNNDNLRLRIESDFFRSSSASVTGRMILDSLNLIKDPFIQEAPTIKQAEFNNYTLEEVSQSILGTGKLIKGKDRHKEINELYKTNQKKLAEYNLQDCKLVYDILEKTKLLDLLIDRSQLTGLTLDRLSGSISAFDSLYIREARAKHLVSPTTIFTEKEKKLTGGYVFSSHQGIFDNVLVFDFKSLYPSIIKTFNIDPASFLGNKKSKNSIEAPNKVYFENTNGILPDIITKLHSAREKAKKEERELANYSIKITMNSFWGVLASQNCRYFNFDMASAITAYARMIIQLTAKKIEEKGYKVIYQDTDSVFIDTELNKSQAEKLSKELENYINNFYKELVKKDYNRESFLELQFAKHYLSMMIPNLREKKGKKDEEEKESKAAKKRYAGLIEKAGKEHLDIVGLEAIRGDWTEAAKEFQRELLMKVFHKESIDVFIKDFIKKVNAGKLDDKLVYRKSIRKNLDEYTKTTPPHVKAARKLSHLDSNIIEYYITEDGPEPIQALKHKLDYEHYIKKQIEPIANQILSLLGKTLEDAKKGQRQSKLF